MEEIFIFDLEHILGFAGDYAIFFITGIILFALSKHLESRTQSELFRKYLQGPRNFIIAILIILAISTFIPIVEGWYSVLTLTSLTVLAFSKLFVNWLWERTLDNFVHLIFLTLPLIYVINAQKVDFFIFYPMHFIFYALSFTPFAILAIVEESGKKYRDSKTRMT